MVSLIEKTAWPMTPPVPYSGFHLLFSCIGIILVLYLARLTVRHRNRKQLIRVLFFLGLLLAVSEGYKQLFLYYVINHRHYDWWYFPFQLCSLPMYLCLLLPFLRHPGFTKAVCTFIRNFGLLGGIMALAEPSGLMHPYWILTIHGLTWHLLLIFISLVITFGHLGSHDFQGYLHTLLLFGIFCIIATVINIATRGASDMFYISPYYPVSQIVFHQISLHSGIAAGIVLYLLSVCTGGYLCHLLAGFAEHYSKI